MATPELILAPGAAQDSEPKLYRLDWDTAEAELRAGKKALIHVFRRPTFEELHQRSQRVVNEEINRSDTETEPVYDDVAANAWLYDRLIQRVKGYRTGREDAGGWSAVGPELLPLIPPAHKRQAISGIYQAQARVVEDDDDGLFPLVGAIETGIELDIAGLYKVRHYLQAPTESQWTNLQKKQVQMRQLRGAKQATYRYSVNLAPARDFYDATLIRIEGAALGEDLRLFDAASRAGFIAAVDPVHKQLIVAAFAAYWGGRLRD